MFNNNNYLPDLNHYRPTGQLSYVSPSPQPQEPAPIMPAVSGFSRSGNFRFLSPTQGTAVPTWMPATSVMNVVSAPGVGANWQHSVPVTMPWANHITPYFTAQNTSSQSLPVYTTPVGVSSQTTTMQVKPKPTVRCQRLKRRFSSIKSDELDGPSSKRYLSEKMANWFRRLQITPTATGKQNGSCGADSASSPGDPSRLDNGWHRFHEVEKRSDRMKTSRLGQDLETVDLEMSAGDRVANGAGASGPEGMTRVLEEGAVLMIPKEMKKEVEKPDPVLPVEIMKTITNPCMDLVVWKPPEAIITNYLLLSPSSSSITTNTSSCNNSSSSCSNHTASTTTTSSTQQSLNGFRSSCGAASVFSPSTSQSSSDMVDMDSGEFYDYMDDDMDL